MSWKLETANRNLHCSSSYLSIWREVIYVDICYICQYICWRLFIFIDTTVTLQNFELFTEKITIKLMIKKNWACVSDDFKKKKSEKKGRTDRNSGARFNGNLVAWRISKPVRIIRWHIPSCFFPRKNSFWMPLSVNLFRLESSILMRAKRATNWNNVATETYWSCFGLNKIGPKRF